MTVEDRARLVAAVLHFALIEQGSEANRLFRNLYVFDVLHFRETGRTATNLEYLAGEFGPYPAALARELSERLRPDLAERVSVAHLGSNEGRDVVHPLTEQAPLADLFSPQELAVLAQVDGLIAASGDLADIVTTLDNGAWVRALKNDRHTPIAMEETVAPEAPNRAAILQQSAEYKGRRARIRALAA